MHQRFYRRRVRDYPLIYHYRNAYAGSWHALHTETSKPIPTREGQLIWKQPTVLGCIEKLTNSQVRGLPSWVKGHMHMLITRGVSNGRVEQHARCVKRTGGTTLTMCQTDGWDNTRRVSNGRVEQHARCVKPKSGTARPRACCSTRSFDTPRVLFRPLV